MLSHYDYGVAQILANLELAQKDPVQTWRLPGGFTYRFRTASGDGSAFVTMAGNAETSYGDLRAYATKFVKSNTGWIVGGFKNVLVKQTRATGSIEMSAQFEFQLPDEDAVYHVQFFATLGWTFRIDTPYILYEMTKNG